MIGALTALFFSNYCVGLKSDSEIRQLAVIRQLRQPAILSALSLIRQSHHLQPETATLSVFGIKNSFTKKGMHLFSRKL